MRRMLCTIVLGVCATTSSFVSSEPIRRRVQQSQLFCEFEELVTSIETHVQSGGIDDSDHLALWERCRSLRAAFATTDRTRATVRPSCGVTEPQCDWIGLVDAYLLHGESQPLPLLRDCAHVRDLLADGSCGLARPDNSTVQPAAEILDPLPALADSNLTAGNHTLPVSEEGVLATLVQVESSESADADAGRRRLAEGKAGVRGSAVPVARSYNGHDWEGSMPSPLSFSCKNGGCTTSLPATGSYTYELRVYNVTEVVESNPAKVVSRFLTQATFGPKRSEIQELAVEHSLEETESRIVEWVDAQMELQPSLHRAYLRRRFNRALTHETQFTEPMRAPCKEGSSWVDIAFSRVDRGKVIDVSLTSTGSYALSIDGVVRTVIDSVTDIRANVDHNCYERGFRTPLDGLPGYGRTDEANVSACHARCVRTEGCAYFSFLPSDVQNDPNGSGRCHLQDSSAGRGGSGGVWRTGRRECVPYEYPIASVPGLENMGASCWGQCQAHGPCPSRCGENGYCCRYTRDLNGCVTTDPTKTTHRCIPDPSMPPPPPAAAPVLEVGQGYILCYATEYAGGDLQLLKPGVPMPSGDWKVSSCQAAPGDMIVLENPMIVLDEPDLSITQQLHDVTMKPIVVGGEMNRFVARNVSEDCALPEIMTVFIQDGGGKYYRHEARVELVVNTIDHPNIERRRQADSTFIPSLTRTMCPAAARSWSNRRGCVRRNACAEPEFSSGTVVLDDGLMTQMFRRSSRYVYYISGLRMDQFSDAEISPCLVGSRWLKTVGSCEPTDTPLDSATRATLVDALQTRIQVDTPHVRTIDAPAPGVEEESGSSCTTQLDGVSTVGAKLTINGTCFVHVHPDEYNVYDFGYWAGNRHPGNAQELAAGRPNPIQNPARVGQVRIEFPNWHSMDRWPPVFSRGNPTTLLRKLGVYGEEVEFSALPTTLQARWLADTVGVVDLSSEDELSVGTLGGMQTEACGSAGEVENRVELGHKYGGRYVYAQKPTYQPTAMLWVNAVFHAHDQLRQRVAWALNQIYVISSIGVETMTEEPWAAYYDIFVRNAFGNFREMLQEVAYAYPMGKMLTFEGSQSAASSGNFADENFARELIQLFTVGLYQLNSDGTPITDEVGNPLPAYDVKDVASFARAWTGFARDNSKLRTNSADIYIGQSQFIDPMVIDATHRDANPKMNLYDGFIGDGFPACVDLPRQPFLRKGAKYEYLGRRLKDCLLPACNDREVSVVALSLHAGSALHQELCGSSDDTTACTFMDEIVLLNNIPCHAEECSLDRVQFVEVNDQSSGRVGYYEYIPTPCVNFPFFLDGRVVKYGSPWHNDLSCSDQRAVAAAPMCCRHGDVSTDGTGDAKCEYQQERVSYQTAIDRCALHGKGLCYGNFGTNTGSCHPYSMWRYSVWLNRPCTVSVQIQRDGRVSVVHQGARYDNTDPSNARIEPEEFAPVISVGSKSIFDVVWRDDTFPRAISNCSNLCMVYGETCVCEVDVEDSAVFTDNSRIPTRAELSESLHIGAMSPEAYDASEYELCTASICNESAIEIWTKRVRDSFGSNSTELTLDEQTVFVVRNADGRTQLYTNRESRVSVQDFSFRNPPTLINYEHPTHRQAAIETNAVLDHLVTHPSTAPFVCKKLIQRLTSSNPSPRYVSEVATAFRTGIYRGRAYSEEYGDLGAAVAAIFLDREARDATLDMDPAAGKLREPLLKVMHLLRSLEFKPRNGIEFELAGMQNKIGMYAYDAPSIFNFYLPDHVPAGPASKAMLVAPEAEILTTPFVIGYMNGVASLVDNGLTYCDRGFAWGSIPTYNPHLYLGQNCRDRDSKRLTNEGDLSYITERSSTLLYNSSENVLGELSLLMTGGHVPTTVRDYYESFQHDQPEFVYDIGPKNVIDTSGCIGVAQDDWSGTLEEAQERCSQLPACYWLHRAEVSQTSLALHKPTSASSRYAGSNPDQVTDGDPRTLFHTDNAANSGEEWFQVDLEAVTVIESVKIWHRTDCCGTRINGATILISDTPDFTAGTQCGGSVEFEDPSSLFECPMSGRYVTVRLTSSFLQLTELEVFGPSRIWRTCGSSTAMVEPVYSTSDGDSHDDAGTRSLARDDWKLGREYWAGDTNTGILSVDDCMALAADWHSREQALLLRPATTYFSYNAGNNWCQFGDQAAFDNGTPSTGDGTYYAYIYTPAEVLSGVAHTRIKRHTDLRDLLPRLIKLFAFSAEFHATNLNLREDQPRAALPEIPSQNRAYKAIIVLFFEGGADSFSMLVPLSNCQASVGDLYAEYAAVRGNVALTTTQILPLSPVETNPDFPDAPTQPCTTFGTHPSLGIVQTLWEAGDAAWFANMGALVEPLTLEQWNTKRKDGRAAHIPPSLFGHDTQQRQCQSVHSDSTGAKGVLGRMMEALTTQEVPYRSGVYSVYGIRKLLEGDVPSTVMSLTGIDRFAQYTEMRDSLQSIVGRESRSVFADTYAGILEKSLEETERLGAQMSDVELIGAYAGGTGLENVAKTIALRQQLEPEVNSERDVFMVGRRTFDSHQNLYSMNANHLANFDRDLEALHTDLTAIGLWESVVVLTISDFARTLTSNGLGTDHAWGGNYFMLGGSVKGKQIHGQFPDDLDPATSQLEVGRGRGVLIPTTPWEGMWFGVAQWFGVEPDQLAHVVPNAANFVEGNTLFTKEQLFHTE